jgi:hypothetical protein
VEAGRKDKKMSSKSERKKKVKAEKQTAAKQRFDHVLEAIITGNHRDAARSFALLGAEYLVEEITGGKANDEASFMPEMLIINDNKVLGVALLAFGEGATGEDITVFAREKSKEAQAIAVVSAAWVSKSTGASERASQLHDRITASVGTVFVNGAVVASVAVPVGTRADLVRCGMKGIVVPDAGSASAAALKVLINKSEVA